MIEWKQRTSSELAPELVSFYQLSPIAAKLFSLRGIDTKEKLDFWLNASEEDLADPKLMHDLAKAVKRINQAIDNGEKITIYGDYDADGITATTIMVETLSILGADVHFFIPDRFRDGYGPNLQAYKRIVADGTKLIITVDNGITGIEEVAYANSQGVDTIISDHHKMQEAIPDCYALVHCNFPGQDYPFDDYCGAGVAYTICRELMQDPMSELLELAMIGTIGDMVKVSGEGHIIVKRGLEMLNQTERPGLRALIKNAGLTLGQINETDVGFNIAPRLNAVGRLANAQLAVELLLCDDEDKAQEIADQVEHLNEERKDLTLQVNKTCLKQVKTRGWQVKNTLVIYDPDFHEGVLGLVANRMAEQMHKPTIVLTKNDEGIIKGSGRSIPGFNLFDALNPLKEDLLLKFGGHDFACGLSLEEDKIAPLRDAFEKSFHSPHTSLVKHYDGELPFTGLDLDTTAAINQVGPFGTDNSQPIFSISHPQISGCFFMGKDKNHIKLTITKDSDKLDVVGFNKKFLTKPLLAYIDQLFIQLEENCFRGQVKVQGIMQGIIFAAPQVIKSLPVVDLRQEKHVMGFADRYLLFDEKNRAAAIGSLNIDPQKLALVSDYNDSGEVAVLLDTPHSQQELNSALQADYQQLYLRFLLDQLPVQSIPGKELFASVLKYVYLHGGLTIKDYRQVASFLKVDYPTLLFVLRVFFELKFVNLDQDKLFANPNPSKQPLTASRYYRATQTQVKFVQELRQMSSSQLLMYVKQQLKRH